MAVTALTDGFNTGTRT